MLDEIKRLKAQGLSNRAIAKQLGISETTVRRAPHKEEANARRNFERARARALANQKQDDPTEEAPRKQEHDDGSVTASAVTVDCIRSEDDLLRACSISLKDYVIVDRSHRAWTQLGAESRIYQMHHVSIRLAPRLSRLYRQAQRVFWPAKAHRQPLQRKTVAFIPDSQNGYVWDSRHRYLEPLHDRLAWDVAVQLCEDQQPEVIFLLGDMLDLAALSLKYTKAPTYNMTTQPALDELHWWLARLRHACPDSRIVYQAGNHESRKDRLVHDKAPELSGLKQANTDHEVLSLTHLLRLDELRIECVEEYGDGSWLWRDEAAIPVRVHHGDVVRGGGGQTAKAVAAKGRYHSVFGHIHRNELVSATTHGPDGHYHLHTLTPGCLCRVDGAVPGVSRQPDWQQGLGFMSLVDGVVHPELVQIQGGVAVRGGKVYRGEDRSAQIASDTRWPQMTV